MLTLHINLIEQQNMKKLTLLPLVLCLGINCYNQPAKLF